MNTVISGCAGIAILIEGENLSSITMDRSKEPTPRKPYEYHLLIGEAKNLKYLEDVKIEKVRDRLELAFRREQALSVVLILLDRELEDRIREMAAKDLEECFKIPTTVDSLANVLYAAPLPKSADLVKALEFSKTQYHHVWEFLIRLESMQSMIQKVGQVWENLAKKQFVDLEMRSEAKTLSCLRARLFRDLVDALNHNKPLLPIVLESVQTHGVLEQYRDFLITWLEDLE